MDLSNYNTTPADKQVIQYHQGKILEEFILHFRSDQEGHKSFEGDVMLDSSSIHQNF